jgi:hypothetical protein
MRIKLRAKSQKPTKAKRNRFTSRTAREAGSVSSPAKARAVRENGELGGRPEGSGNPAIKRIMRERGVSRQRAWVIWKARQRP